jgi:hypothetical protein
MTSSGFRSGTIADRPVSGSWGDFSDVAVVHGGTPRMRNPLSGPVATLLMFVPLVAIPLFAVFGTPQISTTGSPAAQVEDLKFALERDKPSAANSLPEGDLVSAVQVSDGNTTAQNATAQNPTGQDGPQPSASAAAVAKNEADPFAEFVRPAEGETRRSDAATGNQTAPAERRPLRGPADDANNAQPQKTALASNDPVVDEGRAARPDRESAGGNPFNESSAGRSRSKSSTRMTAGFDANRGGEPSEEAKGLRSAIARLNALGITDYQWQPGDHDGEFLFRCRLVSRHNPRMMQRFEAEASEPLQALEKVLVQIDEWRTRRTGRDARTSVGDAPANATVMAPREENVPASTLDVINR